MSSKGTNQKEFIVVCAALFLLLFGTYISGTLLVPYTISLGGNGMTIGIVYSCMYAVRLIFGTPIGRLSQRKGAKRILSYSMALFPFIAVSYWISWNMPSLIFTRFLHGVASAMLLPMAMAYFGECSPQGGEGRYMSIYNTICFAASAFGPVVGGFIYERYGMRTAFAALFGLAVVSFAMISSVSRGWRVSTNKAADAEKPDEGGRKLTWKQLLGNKALIALGALNISMAVLLALFGASFTQFALSRRIGMGQIGILIAVTNIVIGLAQIPFGRFADRHNKSRMIVISGLAAAVLTACLPFAGGLLTLLIFVVFTGIFIALNIASTSALAVKTGRDAGMSNTMGFLGTANSAGTILGYLALGFFTDLFNVKAAFYFTGCTFILGLFAFLLLYDLEKALHAKESASIQ